MPLTQITIKNYKSLANLQLKMTPFMVFVGPNNAGKSNIFDCFLFLSEFVKMGTGATKPRGGFEQLVFNGAITQTISIELQGLIKVQDEERLYKYFIELIGDRLGNCYNKRETLSVVEDGERMLLELPEPPNSAVVSEGAGGSLPVSREKSCLSYFDDQGGYPILGRIATEIQNWAFFNLLPPLMRSSLPVKRELQLHPWGENLPVVLHALQTENPQRFKKIVDILGSAVPELEELTTGLTAHEHGQTYVRMRERGLKISIPAWAMSDGTLRLLGLLVTLYSPSLPPLVCFEEPENYVHPRLLELLVDLLRNASEKTQVLVATHSPYLVDRLEPEDLIIVEKREGKTQIRILEDKKAIREALKTLTLGEMWYSGDFGGVP